MLSRKKFSEFLLIDYDQHVRRRNPSIEILSKPPRPKRKARPIPASQVHIHIHLPPLDLENLENSERKFNKTDEIEEKNLTNVFSTESFASEEDTFNIDEMINRLRALRLAYNEYESDRLEQLRKDLPNLKITALRQIIQNDWLTAKEKMLKEEFQLILEMGCGEPAENK